MPATTIDRSALFANYTHSEINIAPAALGFTESEIETVLNQITTLEDAKAFILAYMKFDFHLGMIAEARKDVTLAANFGAMEQARQDIQTMIDQAGFTSFVDVAKTGYDRMINAGLDADTSMRLYGETLILCGFLSNMLNQQMRNPESAEQVLDFLEFIATPEPEVNA